MSSRPYVHLDARHTRTHVRALCDSIWITGEVMVRKASSTALQNVRRRCSNTQPRYLDTTPQGTLRVVRSGLRHDQVNGAINVAEPRPIQWLAKHSVQMMCTETAKYVHIPSHCSHIIHKTLNRGFSHTSNIAKFDAMLMGSFKK